MKFQPSPDPKAGCDPLPHHGLLILVPGFNPHPTRRPGATRRDGYQQYGAIACFNPHPTRRPGATLTWASRCGAIRTFQPSPDPKAGCDDTNVSTILASDAFQPSPDPKAGCDAVHRATKHHCRGVSTLTRPEGRVRRCPQSDETPLSGCFNPHPTRRPGATSVEVAGDAVGSEFQPSPDPKAGCDHRRGICEGCRECVSTLTRPEGRVRHGVTVTIYAMAKFQPSPDPKAGCDSWDRETRSSSPWFQPSPDPKAGCDAKKERKKCINNASFNPHPTRRPGATRQQMTRGCIHLRSVFQPSPDPKAGCDEIVDGIRHCSGCFNPHPTRRPGATFAPFSRRK